MAADNDGPADGDIPLRPPYLRPKSVAADSGIDSVIMRPCIDYG
jgi:hypothetical protein